MKTIVRNSGAIAGSIAPAGFLGGNPLIDWMELRLIGILLLYRATTHGDGARILEMNTTKEFPQGRDMHARSPWNSFPDYYL